MSGMLRMLIFAKKQNYCLERTYSILHGVSLNSFLIDRSV